MNKLKEIKDREESTDSKVIGYSFHCPGCEIEHKIFLYPYKSQTGASWDFVGTLKKPSVVPDIVNKRQLDNGSEELCHLHLLAGKLWFLNNCTHKLAGEVIDLEDIVER